MVRKAPDNRTSGMNTLVITLRHLGHKYQLLLIPITAFIGIEQAFITADFTKVTPSAAAIVHPNNSH